MAVERTIESHEEQRIAPGSRPGRGMILLRRHWEVAAYLALMVVALGTRMWDVGGRALHYDEVLHAWYAWRFAEGMGYSHTPLTHGPFLFHANAAIYFILGASDVTARLLPALFGTALAGLPYLLRRELGRYGALATAVMLTISPSFLYFSRFTRNDVYMAVYAVVLIAIIWRHRAQPRFSLLIAWAAVWALAFSTKETAYILAAILGLLLFVMSYQAFFNWVRGRAKLSELPPEGQLLLLLVTLSLPLWAPLVALFQDFFGFILANHDPNDPRVMSGEIARAATETGAPAVGARFIAAFIVAACVGISVAMGLLWNWRRWPVIAAVFVAIWLTLYTSVFTNMQGFFTGLWGSLGYWIAQQPVERASQPWYYYFVGLSVYEFLPVLAAIPGGVFLVWKGRAFDRFLVAWALLTLAAFVYAGEKMPWLLVGVTLPFILIAGRAIGVLVQDLADDRRFSVHVPPFLLGATITVALPFAVLQVAQRADFYTSLGFWAAAVVTLAAVSAAASRRTIQPAAPALPLYGRALVLGSLAVLAAFTVWNAARASYPYSGHERPKELLVYSQTGQETKYAAECVDRVARESGVGREGLRFIVDTDDNFQWQWRWYLRDYPNVEYRSLGQQALAGEVNGDFVLMSRGSEGGSQAALAEGFVKAGELRHLWWFPNTAYEGLTPKKLLDGALSRDGWRSATRYFFDRELGTPMYESHGVVYVSKAYEGLAVGCTDLRDSPSAVETGHP